MDQQRFLQQLQIILDRELSCNLNVNVLFADPFM